MKTWLIFHDTQIAIKHLKMNQHLCTRTQVLFQPNSAALLMNILFLSPSPNVAMHAAPIIIFAML
uniref:hypothetical protein n=1 Tax=Salmonella sp. s51228 TaxID=3159652 RepID=UPI00397EF6B1